jgi:hypothetical protein
MSVSEHKAKGEDKPEADGRSLLEEVCDTLHNTHWDSLTMKTLFQGIETVDRARLFARAEAHRRERHDAEPRKHVVAKANELAQKLEGGDKDGA